MRLQAPPGPPAQPWCRDGVGLVRRRTATERSTRHRGATSPLHPAQVIKASRAGSVACHRHGTGLSRFLPRLWDHPGCQSWDHRRVDRRWCRGKALPIRPDQQVWRGRVVFREVAVIEIREVLRCWLGGVGLRTAAERAGVDRKTARRYVEAAVAAGLTREGGEAQLTDELVGAVVTVVRPARRAPPSARKGRRRSMPRAATRSSSTSRSPTRRRSRARRSPRSCRSCRR